jgi:hypothetical protein
MRHFCLLLLLLLPCAVQAKRVSDRTHSFSIEVPDDWRFISQPSNVPKTPNTIFLATPDKKRVVGMRGIKNYNKSQPNLDQWADLTASLFATLIQQPTRTIEYVADKEPARVMDGLFGRMCQSTAMVTLKNGTAAVVFVVSENGEKDHLKMAEGFFSGFTWDK